VPIFSVFLYAGFRLMPSIQQIYSSYSQIRYVSPAFKKIYKDISTLRSNSTSNSETDNNKVFKGSHKIRLRDVCFNYPGSGKKLLKSINLEIPFGSKVVFVGPSGSGKTTIIDIILGLIEPNSGCLEIDGQEVNSNNILLWQSLIGYVPQHIYLSDDTIESNIAFSLESHEIDQDLIIESAKKANLHDFVFDELPEKYLTNVGERGSKLSGGQIQRIAIARAFYKKPKILVMDEPTSSLDKLTEEKIVKALINLNKDTTLIMVSHNDRLLKNFDFVFYIEDGKLISQQSFDEIKNLNNNN